MKVLDGIEPKLAHWLLAQPMFVVATAPMAADGHVNVSPKGMAGTFAVLDQYRVGYLDYFGSGAETIAHLRENGRITLMFTAFSGRPTVVRLYGRGRVVLVDDPEFAELRGIFSKARTVGQRSIVLVELDRVQESCGYAVPLMDFVADREVLDLHQLKKGPQEYDGRGHLKNPVSIDGLPALADGEQPTPG
ncbi:MAG TPA: pyridoxamine 5'-phosphate oxidase family protein [Rhodanobacteraceae bacterium]|nr:pyridoxamine 5'-phosphate oxidase family protein [Rhodanobacteraceae bacterium]